MCEGGLEGALEGVLDSALRYQLESKMITYSVLGGEIAIRLESIA